MHLAFGGARTDSAPGDQVADVLRRDHIEELAARGQTQPVDIDEQLARHAQALVDAVALVQIGVVDQAFPAHGGARLFKIHAHHNFERVGIARPLLDQLPGVVDGRGRVVDRARPHDDKQAVVAAGHDVGNGRTGAADQAFDGRTPDREKADQMLRRWQHGDVLDAFVIGLTGLVERTRIPRLAGGRWGSIHDGLLGRDLRAKKKPPGLPAVCLEGLACICLLTREPLDRRGRQRTKSRQSKTRREPWARI